MSLVRIKTKGQVTLPASIRLQAKLKVGDFLEVKQKKGKIVMTPQAVIDLSGFPNANDEYTPRQRKIIDRRLAKAMNDPRPSYGPFETAEEGIKFLHDYVKRSRKKRAKK